MTSEERTGWHLREWNGLYCMINCTDLPPMTREEIKRARSWLRERNYPAPADCPAEMCPKYRPGCELGVCHIAAGMCGDL